MQRRKVRRLCSAAFCAIFVVGLASPSVAGQNDAQHDDAVVAEVRQELTESSEAMVRAAADLRRANRAVGMARKRAALAKAQLAQAQRREDAAAEKQHAAQSELMLATEAAEASAVQVTEQREQLGRVARAAYQQGGAMGSVAVLLDATSASDFTERLVALDQVVTSQRSVLAELQTAERRTKNRTYVFEHTRDQLTAAHQQAEAEAESVATLVETSAAAELEVERLVAVHRAALAAATAARAEDERRLLELQGESDRLAKLLAEQAQSLLGDAGVRAGPSYPAKPGVLMSPVGGSVTSPFGMRVHPVTGVYKLHSGTDFGVGCGSPIVAARGGAVIAAGFNRAYGWRTVISHGIVDNALLTTTYNHQTHIGVQVGQRVKAGEAIGTVGSTGYSTGCHLHFELIINSDIVDPMPWLKARQNS